jgi:uncharacterized protein involved in exopolysaccharide biosynthesis
MVEEEGIAIDYTLLRTVVRDRLRRRLTAGACLLLLALLYIAFVMKQSFTATVSLSFPQRTPAVSGFASLIGLGGPSGKYVGVVKSRRLGEQVSRKANLQSFYNLEDMDQTWLFLQDQVDVDDNIRDGLLYVSISLPAPPRFRPGTSERRENVRKKVAEVANYYAEALRNYIINSDIDRDTVLIREAERQLREARTNYNASVGELVDLVRQSRVENAITPNRDMDRSGSAAGNKASPQAVDEELLQLYTARANLEAEIQSAEAGLRLSEQLRARQLEDLSRLPSEDPLLMAARADADRWRAEVNRLRIQFGPGYPDLRVAQEQLRQAEERLQKQSRSVREQLTSQSVEAKVNLDALKAKYDVVVKQIRDVEKRSKLSREAATQYELLQNQVLLALDVLKTTATQYATLSLQTLSAKSQVALVDRAFPPLKGNPGFAKPVIVSFLLIVTFLAMWIGVDYWRAVNRRVDAARAAISAEVGDGETQPRHLEENRVG